MAAVATVAILVTVEIDVRLLSDPGAGGSGSPDREELISPPENKNEFGFRRCVFFFVL